jgi:hypothetical protein
MNPYSDVNIRLLVNQDIPIPWDITNDAIDSELLLMGLSEVKSWMSSTIKLHRSDDNVMDFEYCQWVNGDGEMMHIVRWISDEPHLFVSTSGFAMGDTE